MTRFVVEGKPEPQGSMRAFAKRGRLIVTSANTHLKEWRQLIADTARALNIEKLERHIAVCLSLHFFFTRPKSAPKHLKHHTVRPDLDKLTRAVLDALTGVAWVDDSQVSRFRDTGKDWGDPARVEIEIEAI